MRHITAYNMSHIIANMNNITSCNLNHNSLQHEPYNGQQYAPHNSQQYAPYKNQQLEPHNNLQQPTPYNSQKHASYNNIQHEPRNSLQHASLKVRNKLRQRHGVRFVEWDLILADYAQRWVNRCHYSHSHDYRPYRDHCGENIAYGFPSMSSVIKHWYYDEIDDYDFYYNKSRNGRAHLHFTQIVWERTSKIGSAQAYCDNLRGYFFLCNYYPPGNADGNYVQNVFPVLCHR